MVNNIPVYAHRGASAYVLENSMEAFEKAIALHADGIELDVQCSKEGTVFVYHDLNLKRLTGVDKFIHDCTDEELCNFRIGRRTFFRFIGNKRIPTFEKVLEWANKHNVKLNIELKESLIDNLDPMIRLLKSQSLPKGSHVSSFHDVLLEKIKKECPHVETAIIVTRKFDWAALDAMKHIDAVHAHKRYYKPRFLQICEKAKKPMRFYAIDGKEAFLQRPHPVVAGWITDFPDRLAKKQPNRKKKV
ncbi:glycerophosphodiester phosphodiesterase [Lysinibacillus odysseyi]|uniref:Glycerophosphodiester phosphodiesterase n=1 Tax=Lysinibacillus odysseyi 34hs-1 = NBRC 100172 TaxID=1220589 RepID=A0A0A3J3K5_9BACI|nr:glycerophosphodiester phosphodiesterase family protein [Lysinibacillus odysseyi]KGR81632.1 glycerophosphodiester phosphodiesterase [Lysinibacillus odysseyi 34hs-1 = NBRC 100172]